MRVRISAIGRVKRGVEAELIDTYVTRFERIGANIGLGPIDVVEHDERKLQGGADEARALMSVVPERARTVALDERGRLMSSEDFAGRIAGWRDDGVGNCVFLIGGADGLAPDVRSESDLVLSFGKMVWPHKLVRVMLAEQIYRAATILSGSPYHRD